MKIHILYNVIDSPYGGGNQFLKYLINFLNEKNLYTTDIAEADIILFNSHHNARKILELRLQYGKNKIFIHRLDGKISLQRKSKKFDYIIMLVNILVSDFDIYQSEYARNIWSKSITPKPHKVIYNSVDKQLFFKTKHINQLKSSNKLKIITTCWSTHDSKGFDTYKYLDKYLNFDKYEYIFVGNSPIKFNNIQIIPPQNSLRLNQLLNQSDIFITASINDPCSNSLLEAKEIGLKILAKNSGGHPELISPNDRLFNTKHDLLAMLNENNLVTESLSRRFQDNESSSGFEATHNYLELFKYVNEKRNFYCQNLIIKCLLIVFKFIDF